MNTYIGGPLTRRRVIALLVATVLPSWGIAATSRANFSGTWELDHAKTSLGDRPFPRWASHRIRILHVGNRLTFDRFYVAFGEEWQTTERYTIDGKPATNPVVFQTTKESTARLSDDRQVLTISSEMILEFDRIKTTEVLSRAGEELTITLTSWVPTGEKRATLVYTRR